MKKNNKRIGMIVFSYYPEDPRVRREAEALVEKGYDVDVYCLKNENQEKETIFRNVHVFRLPLKRKRKGKINYLFEYINFIILSFIYLSIAFVRNPYRIVHVHNMPDILVFSAIFPKLMGSKIILDLHDPMPEVYMTKYHLNEDHIIIKILKRLEKYSIKFADLVFTPNIRFKYLFDSRLAGESKIHVVLNSPDEKIFSSFIKKDSLPKFTNFRIMYHGTLVQRHGLETALEALKVLRKDYKEIEFHVFGEGDYAEEFQQKVLQNDLQENVKYYGHVSLERIAEIIPTMNLGIIPNLRSPFTEINLPTRIFEYLSMGVPVIAPRTQGITDYFNDDSLFMFEPGDSTSLATEIDQVFRNPEKRKYILNNGLSVYKKHCWENEKKRLTSMVAHLLENKPIADLKSTHLNLEPNS